MTAPRILAGGFPPDGPLFPHPEDFQRIPARFSGKAKQWFVYGTDFLPLTASAQLTQNIQIQSDSDFVVVAAKILATDTANTTRLTFIPQTVFLFNAGSGGNLFNTAQPVHSVFGTGEEPAYWELPYVLTRASTFSVQLANLEAVDRNVRVGFYGFKVFDMAEGTPG